MKQKRNRRTSRPWRVLRLFDLEHARTAVLNSLSSSESQREYRLIPRFSGMEYDPDKVGEMVCHCCG